ncbi:TPA: hypothetical protein N0F65_000067, partial [Lagenidium giganteum]
HKHSTSFHLLRLLTMFRTALVIAAACGLVSADNLRQEQDPRALQEQSDFDFYVLAQSWQPQFCKGKLNQFPGCRNPQQYWQSHFTLHGLWPEYNSGAYPQNCNPNDYFDEDTVVNAVGKDALLQYWPNVKKSLSARDYSQFWQHEWDVHGTCSGLDQATFFKVVVDLLRTETAMTPDVIQNNVGRSVSTDDVRAAFGGSEYVVLRCNGKELAEVRTCWAKDNQNLPTSQVQCSDQVQSQDSCRGATVFIRSTPSHARLAMLRTALLLVAAACGLGAAENHRQLGVQQIAPQYQPGVFDFYVLALSWQPRFCKGNLNKYPGCRTPQEYWQSHFTLHGLWPEFTSAKYPHDCDPESQFDESAVVDAVGKDALLQYWPNVKKSLTDEDYSQFWQHEWDVHGTCSGLDQPTFFNTVVGLLRTEAITTPDIIHNNVGRSVSADDVRAAYGGNEYVALICKGKELMEVRTCWAKDEHNMPTAQIECSEHVQSEDSCRGETVYIRSFEDAVVFAS